MPARSFMPPRSTGLPFSNYALLVAMTCLFAVQMLFDPGAQYLSGLVLERCSVSGLLGHMWLHMTLVHLVGNLITLWIFGYYVCGRMGHRTYAIAYVAAGVGAGLVHLAYDGRPVIGASGAIMGVLGLHVVLCFDLFGRLGPWLILTWFVGTVGAGLIGGLPASYAAHAGGFVTGILVGLCLTICHAGIGHWTSPALSAVAPALPCQTPAIPPTAPGHSLDA